MILLLFYYRASSQRHGFEEFFYPASAGAAAQLSSRVFYGTAGNWYTELRYNYEAQHTLACSVGKTFHKESTWSYSLTPEAGLAGGRLQGVSAGLNGDLSWKTLSLSSSLSYTSCVGRQTRNLLYSWSELACRVTKNIYAGLAMQQTGYYHMPDKWEPGLTLGFSLKEWNFPVYLFLPGNGVRYFAAGISREWKR